MVDSVLIATCTWRYQKVIVSAPTGWGRTVGGRTPGADYLQEAKLTVKDFESCKQKNGYLLPIVDASMLCAGENGKGGCQGDSGGPFVCEEGGSFVLRGIVSWGHSLCRTDHYTVFARVSSFINWINEKSGAGNNQIIMLMLIIIKKSQSHATQDTLGWSWNGRGGGHIRDSTVAHKNLVRGWGEGENTWRFGSDVPLLVRKSFKPHTHTNLYICILVESMIADHYYTEWATLDFSFATKQGVFRLKIYRADAQGFEVTNFGAYWRHIGYTAQYEKIYIHCIDIDIDR